MPVKPEMNHTWPVRLGRSFVPRKRQSLPSCRSSWTWSGWVLVIVPLLLAESSLAEDCNGNAVDDAEDLRSQSSQDCNANGVPDECESAFVHFGRRGDAFQIPGAVQAMLQADLDRDGTVDLVFPSTDSAGRSVLTVALNENSVEPGEFFSRRNDYLTAGRVRAVAAGDLDGDGDLDLVAVEPFEGENLWIHWNAGDGTFSEVTKWSLENGVKTACLRDFDGDGALDFVGTNTVRDVVVVLLNRGDGTFADAKEFSVGDGPTSLACADLDGDGSVDLLTGNERSRDVSILLNDGQSGFVALAPIEVGSV